MVGIGKKSIMTVYSSPVGIRSHQVRFALSLKDVNFELIDIFGNLKAQNEVYEFNPYGEAPVILDRDLVLHESFLIMEYLDERFPYPPLMPVYPVVRAKLRLLIYRIYKDWFTHVDVLENEKSSDLQIKKAKKELLDALIGINENFKQNKYFMGEEITLIDCVVGPLLWRLPHWQIKLPDSAKAVKSYAEQLFELEAFGKSLSMAEHEIREMR